MSLFVLIKADRCPPLVILCYHLPNLNEIVCFTFVNSTFNVMVVTIRTDFFNFCNSTFNVMVVTIRTDFFNFCNPHTEF